MLRWAGIDNGSRPLSCWWWLTSWGGCSFDEFLAFSWGSSLFWGHDLSSSHRNTLTCGHGRRRCVFNPWRCDTLERIFFYFCFVEWWADTFNTRSFGLILVRSGQKKLASLLQYVGYVVTPLFMLSVLPFLFHFTYSFQQHVNYPWENEHWNGAPSTSTKTTSPNELRAMFYSTTLTNIPSVDPCLYANQQYTHCALCWGNSRFFCFSKPRTFTRKSDPFSHETLHFTRLFRTNFHKIKEKQKLFTLGTFYFAYSWINFNRKQLEKFAPPRELRQNIPTTTFTGRRDASFPRFSHARAASKRLHTDTTRTSVKVVLNPGWLVLVVPSERFSPLPPPSFPALSRGKIWGRDSSGELSREVNLREGARENVALLLSGNASGARG